MNPKTQILGAVTRLAQSKNANVSDAVLRTYAELLADLPFDQIASACGRLAATKTFGMPQVGEIREEVTRATIGDVKGRALEAWAEVLRACRQAGAYRDVQFDDPAMGQALRVAAGSWPNVCRLESDSYEFSKVRETFLEMYANYGATPHAGAEMMCGIGSSKAPYVVPRIDGLSNDRLLALASPAELPAPSRSEAAGIMRDLTRKIEARVKA